MPPSSRRGLESGAHLTNGTTSGSRRIFIDEAPHQGRSASLRDDASASLDPAPRRRRTWQGAERRPTPNAPASLRFRSGLRSASVPTHPSRSECDHGICAGQPGCVVPRARPYKCPLEPHRYRTLKAPNRVTLRIWGPSSCRTLRFHSGSLCRLPVRRQLVRLSSCPESARVTPPTPQFSRGSSWMTTRIVSGFISITRAYVSVGSPTSCRFVSSSRGDAFKTWIRCMTDISPWVHGASPSVVSERSIRMTGNFGVLRSALAQGAWLLGGRTVGCSAGNVV